MSVIASLELRYIREKTPFKGSHNQGQFYVWHSIVVGRTEDLIQGKIKTARQTFLLFLLRPWRNRNKSMPFQANIQRKSRGILYTNNKNDATSLKR